MSNSSSRDEIPPSQWQTSLRRRLLRWYESAARDLPWRRTRDPYRIWVSEIMLQQTQVATVIRYYERFLARFPTVLELADAAEEQVLRQWEGLGYYRRARQMHVAAQLIRDVHEGAFPRDLETVKSLPGIGRYTAGAILSFAFDLPHPIVEANTIRLYSRLLGYADDPTRSSGQRLLWEFSTQLAATKSPGRVNQALMELGATVCVPRNPDCRACCLSPQCRAWQEGAVARIPLGKKPMSYESITEAAVVVRGSKGVLLRRCQADERWAGLWDFPRVSVHVRPGAKRIRQVADDVSKQMKMQIDVGRQFHTLKHAVTKYRIHLVCYFGSAVEEGRRTRNRRSSRSSQQRWVQPERLEAMPLSVTGRKIARLITA